MKASTSDTLTKATLAIQEEASWEHSLGIESLNDEALALISGGTALDHDPRDDDHRHRHDDDDYWWWYWHHHHRHHHDDDDYHHDR